MKYENETTQLADRCLFSTAQMSRELGFPFNISVAWIERDLGIKPHLVLRGGGAVYWHQSQFREVRRALIKRLLDQEFAETPGDAA